MKEWSVILKFNDGTKNKLNLYDANRYFDGYLRIKRSYFNTLNEIINKETEYDIGKAIEKVESPNGKDWTLNPWILIIAKENEMNKTFWLLIKREKDLSGILIAIGPKLFAKYNNTNSEAKREVMRVFNYLTVYLEKFQCSILLPNHILKGNL
ncbi:MAG: hypothetical protein EU550_00460 [Promethearchaeota archaeon]|nr:MAG: hypothetical protein EU550_00460 [Candidatus Lokiarchaeota archaeon]